MSSQKEKLTIKNKLTFDDIEIYDFVHGNKRPRRVRGVEELKLRFGALAWRDNYAQNAAKDDREPSRELQEAFVEARRFVEELVGIDLSWVKFARSDQESGHVTAQYSPVDGTVRVFRDIENRGDERLYEASRNQNIATLVHELMHAAAQDDAKIIGIRYDGGLVDPIVAHGLSAIDMRGPILEANGEGEGDDITINTFLNEAMSEEAAARWRETHVASAREYGDRHCNLLGHKNDPSLQFRFIDSYEGYHPEMVQYEVAESAYAAAGLRALSDYVGTDIFQVLARSLHPEQQVGARREAIQLIEGVKKGLYVTLRESIYTSSSFLYGYEQIMIAISEKINGEKPV